MPKLSDPATVFIKPAKRAIDFATIPASKAPWMAQELRDAFPQLRPVKNVLTTSLNSTNPPIHVPVSLFNITRIANQEDALFYQTGLPPVLSDFLAAADGERVAVGKAVGAEVSLAICKAFKEIPGLAEGDYDKDALFTELVKK